MNLEANALGSPQYGRPVSTPCPTPARRSHRRRVLLALYWWEDRVFEGVAKVAAERGWILDCRMRWTHMLPDLPQWRGDGIIANPGISQPLGPLLELLENSGIPAVGLQRFGDYPCALRVVPDHAAIGRLAAQHLLSLGFKHLGYVLFAENPIERARSNGFAEAVRTAGATFQEIPFDHLRAQLEALPKPLALWTVNDRNAIDVTTACLDADLQVPEEVAVMGADDSRILCDFAEVPLSSVNCNFEAQGFAAATRLHHLMEGEADAGETILIQPTGVSRRRSTDTVAIPDLAAIRALRILRDRFQEPLSIPEVAREVGVSVRRLQDAFRQHLGFTMVHEQMRVRVEHARRLLSDRQLKLDAVALESGFSSRFHLIRAFQRITGETPAAYRKRFANADAESASGKEHP